MWIRIRIWIRICNTGGNVTRGKIYVERIKGGRERRICSGEKGVLESRREGCIEEGFLVGQTQSSSHRLCTSEFLTHDSESYRAY
jgi:hypothetical protein